MTEEKDLQRQILRIEELVGKIESLADPDAKANSRELVQSLMDLHGAGIERMLEKIADTGPRGMEIIDELARDTLISSLLLLYGLHPLDLETRVIRALDKVRPYLQSQGGNVEMLGVDDGVVRLRLEGSGHGCASSAQTLKLAIEEAIYDAAPDVTGLQMEGVIQQATSGLVQLQGRAVVNNKDGWTEVGGLDSLIQGAARTIQAPKGNTPLSSSEVRDE